MPTVFMETPDATQATQFWTSITGTVTYDTTQKKSGLASWKADSGAGNAAAFLRKDSIMPGGVSQGGRVTTYFRLTDLPGGTTTLFSIATGSFGFRVRITSGGVLQLWDNISAQVGINGSTLSIGIWYRLSTAYKNNASNQITDIKLFLNGTQDISVTGLTLGAGIPLALSAGWEDAPGASKILHFHHVYADDSTALTDTGDIRVTAKLPAAVNNNLFDTTIGTGVVNQRPISEAAGKQHAASSAADQDYNLETAAGGDVNISADTIVAYDGWLWAKRSTGGATVHQLRLNGLLYAITLTLASALYNKIIDSATYPTNAAAIGLNRDAGVQDSFLYECGVLMAYKVAAPPAGGIASLRMMRGLGR